MDKFLRNYFEANIKYRQISRATNKLTDIIKSNTDLRLPKSFYEL